MLNQQTGANGVLAVLAGVLVLAFVIWLFKVLRRREAAIVVGLPLVAITLYLPSLVEVSSPTTGTDIVETSGSPGYRGPAWEAWSPDRLGELRREGPVFVNFTAAWCITCKVNEGVALNSERVQEAFDTHGIRYLKGDWTNEDAAITAALAEYDRSGVPLYLLYPQDPQGESRARVLPQVLTESVVLRAIESL